MTDITGPLDQAQAELAVSGIPHPETFLKSYSPPAAFLFIRQCSLVLGEMVVDAAITTGKEDGDDQPVVTEVLNSVAQCIAGATHALVALGVLPTEAEEALGEGQPAKRDLAGS